MMLLEKVVREKAHGNVCKNCGAQFLAADALLQQCERLHTTILPSDELAIEDRAVGEESGSRGDLREPLRDELLATRPDKTCSAAPDELRTDAVPFPFDLPIRGFPECAGTVL